MSDVDPLIRRELQWMALGVLENRDLSVMVIERVRKRRRKRILLTALAIIGTILVSIATYFIVDGIRSNSQNSAGVNRGAVGSLDGNAIDPNKITGIISDYPLTWEQSVGDTGAISKAAGLNDTLGGSINFGATVLKISTQSSSQSLISGRSSKSTIGSNSRLTS